MEKILRRMATYVHDDFYKAPYQGTKVSEHLVTILTPFLFAIIMGGILTYLLIAGTK